MTVSRPCPTVSRDAVARPCPVSPPLKGDTVTDTHTPTPTHPHRVLAPRSAARRRLDAANLLTGRDLMSPRERSAGDWRRRSCAHRVPTDRVPAGQRPVVGLVIRGSGGSAVTASSAAVA
jgi:hypothetical protein